MKELNKDWKQKLQNKETTHNFGRGENPNINLILDYKTIPLNNWMNIIALEFND